MSICKQERLRLSAGVRKLQGLSHVGRVGDIFCQAPVGHCSWAPRFSVISPFD